MAARSRRIRSLELCDPNIFGQIVVTKQTLAMRNPRVRSAVWTQLKPPPIQPDDDPKEYEKRRASVLLDQLLLEIYSNLQTGYSDYNSATSAKSQKASYRSIVHLREQGIEELRSSIGGLEGHVVRIGSILVRQLKRRDALRRQRDARCDVISYLLRKRLPEFSPEMRFSIEPLPGDSGFSQWHSAMKMVSQLPEGIPPEFRRRLWLSLADKHLQSKGIDWARVERNCFSEWSHPADSELGVQIVKDLHRTGCSLFCGKDGQENQALLKRVLLAYARWNKAVGYCQGFNMLAALILQVTEKCETDALKLMIYLIEGVLPDSYFADSLRGLSVDMAVFRELLRTKLPRLSKHLDTLQVASKEGTTSYEPPLTNVFTMQWFLTLFCNCLPQPTVLRVWDLILLEGNEILLRTALAIWQVLADKIMTAKSADEFYCVMGMLMREILEYDLIDANTLIKGIVTIGPLTELSNLREHYLYNINPWGSSVPANDADKRMKVYHKDRLVLDIGVLKKQYTKLKQRQRQAHIIFNTAVARQTARPAPVAMNHLLLGKSALVPAKRLGPPKGAIPPARQPQNIPPQPPPKTLHWKDTRRDSSSSSTSSSDTELCDEPGGADASSDEDDPKCQLPDDNLSEPSDKPLMTEDNTKQTSASASDVAEDLMDLETKPEPPDLDNQIEIKSDIFDNTETSSSDLYDLNALQRSDSIASEDGFDFEKFLEERVKSFKEKTYSSEESIEDTSEQERLKYARRNSVRALEIIQENSLILHRILQCQSRMTPTPPPTEEEETTTTSEENSLNLQIPDLIPREDDDMTPTNEIKIDSDKPEREVSRSASLEGIINKYSAISKESVKLGLIRSDQSLEEVDYNLEKYRQKLGSPIIEEEAKNKQCCEKINKYIQNAIENKELYAKTNKESYNQNLELDKVVDFDYLSSSPSKLLPVTSNERKVDQIKEGMSIDKKNNQLNAILDGGLPKEKGPPEETDLKNRYVFYDPSKADLDKSTENIKLLHDKCIDQETKLDEPKGVVDVSDTYTIEDASKLMSEDSGVCQSEISLYLDKEDREAPNANVLKDMHYPVITLQESKLSREDQICRSGEEISLYSVDCSFDLEEKDKSHNIKRDINEDFAILQKNVRELNQSLTYSLKREQTTSEEDCLPSDKTAYDGTYSSVFAKEDYLSSDDKAYGATSPDGAKVYDSVESCDRKILNLDGLLKKDFEDYENEVFVDKLESPKSLKDFSECIRPSLPPVAEEREETVLSKPNDKSQLSSAYVRPEVCQNLDDAFIKSDEGAEEKVPIWLDYQVKSNVGVPSWEKESTEKISENFCSLQPYNSERVGRPAYNFDFLDELCKKQLAKINATALLARTIENGKEGEQTTTKTADFEEYMFKPNDEECGSKNDLKEDFGTYNYVPLEKNEDLITIESAASDRIYKIEDLGFTEERPPLSDTLPIDDYGTSTSKYMYEATSPVEYRYKTSMACEESAKFSEENYQGGGSSKNTEELSLFTHEAGSSEEEKSLEIHKPLSLLESKVSSTHSALDENPKCSLEKDRSPTYKVHSEEPHRVSRPKYHHSPSSEESMIEISKTSKYTSILEYSRNLDERFNNLILKAPGPNLTYSFTEETASSSNLLKSPSIEGQTSPRSPSRSPSHAYNPFPVNISSRQNKEVAVRLGLYKKS